jgi:hypothetical protein
MNIGTAFPSKYLKASDLGQLRPVVVIDAVRMESIGDDEDKPVVHFQGKAKGLVLNKTNANMIAEITGSQETEHWRGRRIALYASKTDYQGKRVDCVRVDYPPQGAGTPTPPPPPPPAEEFQADDSDVPFAWLLPVVGPAILALQVLA